MRSGAEAPMAGARAYAAQCSTASGSNAAASRPCSPLDATPSSSSVASSTVKSPPSVPCAWRALRSSRSTFESG
eukprot:3252578-Prymnesium_polylepis.1